MAEVYISIGSNIEREHNVRGAVHDLRAHYGRVDLSPVYENPAEGFAGDPFYNLVARLHTDEEVETIARRLATIEQAHGRTRDTPRFSARTLDMDLLLYSDLVLNSPTLKLPRGEIRKYAFVLKPLYDLAPDFVLPDRGERVRDLWQQFAKQEVNLTVVDLVGL